MHLLVQAWLLLFDSLNEKENYVTDYEKKKQPEWKNRHWDESKKWNEHLEYTTWQVSMKLDSCYKFIHVYWRQRVKVERIFKIEVVFRGIYTDFVSQNLSKSCDFGVHPELEPEILVF